MKMCGNCARARRRCLRREVVPVWLFAPTIQVVSEPIRVLVVTGSGLRQILYSRELFLNRVRIDLHSRTSFLLFPSNRNKANRSCSKAFGRSRKEILEFFEASNARLAVNDVSRHNQNYLGSGAGRTDDRELTADPLRSLAHPL